MLTEEEARDVAEKLFTLGDFAVLMRAMQERGWSRGSVVYVTERVFWE